MQCATQMNICVVGGAGYARLVPSLVLAEIGHQVVSVALDHGRLERLKREASPIYEAGIQSPLRRGRNLSDTVGLCAIAFSDVGVGRL